MLRKLTLRIRLLLLIAVQALVLLVIGGTGFVSLNVANDSLTRLNDNINDQLAVNRLAEIVRRNLLSTTNDITLGAITWEEAGQRLVQARDSFENGWNNYFAELQPAEETFVRALHQPSLDAVRTALEVLQDLFKARDRARLNLFMTNDFYRLIAPYFDILQARAGQQQFVSQQAYRAAQDDNRRLLYASIGVAGLGVLLAGALGLAIYRSVARPVGRITQAVQAVAQGNYEARTEVRGRDELGVLGQAFDQLLQERVATLARTERENEQINTAVIQLLQAVYRLSRRDLTVHVPVTEDVTGPIADALNLLTAETAKVLSQVTRVADDVAAASGKVKRDSDRVLEVAEQELQAISHTITELKMAVAAMNRIAELTELCDHAADIANRATETALTSVTRSVNGINATHDSMRETEKRIKRLGERSQEVSSIVDIINSIAERTHILALNASMHAASAGEAGRGFAIVAKEVQRLAGNAREATSQVATLVGNMQTETSDTVNTMNTAIAQVIEGSRLAKAAGEQMQRTRDSTGDLVESVQQIAASSREQARTTTALLDRAELTEQSTRQTQQRLQEQREQTENLVRYARELVNSVRVFELPPTGNGLPSGPKDPD
ncbi:MAG: methyl-accepting chemotaxis protein [Candidatus Competibacterales bacterium]|nr:methyl-accepting chemotaxis protein [Candidatus Competibacterales bacterium]